MSEQRFMIQFITAENGQRSDCILITQKEFVQMLEWMQESEESQHKEEDYVLMVAAVSEDEKVDVVKTPLQTIGSLMQMMTRTKEERANNG